jgi:hypothetical protein
MKEPGYSYYDIFLENWGADVQTFATNSMVCRAEDLSLQHIIMYRIRDNS